MIERPTLVSDNVVELALRVAKEGIKYQVGCCSVPTALDGPVVAVWVAIPYPPTRFALARAYCAVALGGWRPGHVQSLYGADLERAMRQAPNV